MTQLRNAFAGKLLAACLLLVAGLLASTAAAAPAPPPSARAELETLTGELVAMVGQGRIDQMLDRIGPVPDDDREGAQISRERLINVYGNAGKYSGYDIAGFKSLTPRFQLTYVLLYFEKRPLLLEFGFYQVDGKWRAQTLRVETNFKELLDTMPVQK